jgi:hypothetical protein
MRSRYEMVCEFGREGRKMKNGVKIFLEGYLQLNLSKFLLPSKLG